MICTKEEPRPVYFDSRQIQSPGGILMVRRSSGKFGGSSMLAGPLCLMTNHRLLRSTMSDGREKESCKRWRSGNKSSIWVFMTVVSCNGRNFLRGGSTVGSTGSLEIDDAGHSRMSLFLGVDERCTTAEGRRYTYSVDWVGEDLDSRGIRGGALTAATRRAGKIFTWRLLTFLTFPRPRRWCWDELRYSWRILA